MLSCFPCQASFYIRLLFEWRDDKLKDKVDEPNDNFDEGHEADSNKETWDHCHYTFSLTQVLQNKLMSLYLHCLYVLFIIASEPKMH